MKVRFADRKGLPAKWHPGDPVPGNSVDLGTTHECPFGAECYSCAIGLQWHPGFGTHVKPPANG